MLEPLEEGRRRTRHTTGTLSPPAVAAGRIPPHNLEAEESLLGAMLLSRDATAVAIERCSATDFYRPSHGQIFAAVTAL